MEHLREIFQKIADKQAAKDAGQPEQEEGDGEDEDGEGEGGGDDEWDDAEPLPDDDHDEL